MLYHIISADDEANDDDEVRQQDIEKFKELTKQATEKKEETPTSSKFRIVFCISPHL